MYYRCTCCWYCSLPRSGIHSLFFIQALALIRTPVLVLLTAQFFLPVPKCSLSIWKSGALLFGLSALKNIKIDMQNTL